MLKSRGRYTCAVLIAVLWGGPGWPGGMEWKAGGGLGEEPIEKAVFSLSLQWSKGWHVMLGRRPGHPSNPHRSYQPPQDAVPHRIPSPAPGDVGVFGSVSPELRQPRKPTWGRKACKASPRDSNGRDGETSTFIPGAVDPPKPPAAPPSPRPGARTRPSSAAL